MDKIEVFQPESLYGLIGSPLGHSLSPRLHNFIFARLGLKAVYLPWEIAPGKLGSFMDALRLLPIRGASVTIPHKTDIMPFLDDVSERAAKAGAVNTIFWSDGKVCGDNTDINGFMRPLQAYAAGGGMSLGSALVLGAGGAARAVLSGLGRGFAGKVFLSARNEARAASLAAEFEVAPVPWGQRALSGARLVINTTPLGMEGIYKEMAPFPAEGFTNHGGLAYDLVYNPLHTRFLREAEAAGWSILSGREMFIAQGLEQIRLWTGKEFPRGELPEGLLSLC